MSRARESLAGSSALAATAAGTALVAMWSWRGFAEVPGGYLNPLLLLAIVVAGTGTALRWWRLPVPLVVVLQLLVAGMFTSLLLTGSPLPVAGAWTELLHDIDLAVDSANRYPAPVPQAAPPIDPLLILAGLGCLILVDLLACGLRRVPLAGLPLLTIYSIPVSMVGDSIPWWIFALTAAGFLMMLFLQESDHVSRWGRPIGLDAETGDPIAYGAGVHAVRTTATTIGSVATALAVVVPALIPTISLQVFDLGPGSGDGDSIQIDNPVADLVRDLKRGEDRPLIQVTTTDPDPSYLRILALTRFTEAEWSPGDRKVPADNRADGQLPPPKGVAAEVTRREFPYEVTVLPDFESRWLPTQQPISRVEADGDWRYDDETTDFLAHDEGLTTAGLSYTMSALELELTAPRLEAAGSSTGKVSETFTDVPSDLPSIVRQLAVEVTTDAPTRFEKAVALQNWFRRDGGFSYTLDSAASGNGFDALVQFLSEEPGGREGYCEQFASAMAVMARLLGIPARVAVGFLTPSPAGPETWVYSSHDLHAWPELYFDGAGWVRFEPTPAGRAQDVPSYTVPNRPPAAGPSDSAQPQASESTRAGPTRPTDSQSAAAAADDQADSGTGFPWPAVVGGGVGVLVLLAGLVLPGVVRRRRRHRRLAVGGPEAIWAELRATAIDLGVPWPADRSPRATRDVLVHHLGAPLDRTTPERPAHGPAVAPEAVAALDRLVLALELLRYSRGGQVADEAAVRADAETCLAGLAGGATRAARRRAAWWPKSVLTFTFRAPQPTQATVETRYGGVVDHVG